MRTTLHRWFWIWEFDKEERWLNEMAAKGMALVHVGPCTYEFEDCVPGEYIYRLELLDVLPSSTEGRKYIEFLEETGAEQIGSYIRWCYFRRKAELGAFDLFSDFDSRIRHLNRMLLLVTCFLPLELFAGLSNLLIHFQNGNTGNLIAGCLCLSAEVIMLLAFVIISGKKHKLKKEREISES